MFGASAGQRPGIEPYQRVIVFLVNVTEVEGRAGVSGRTDFGRFGADFKWLGTGKAGQKP